MKISVVIPVHNEEEYITKCLNGLKRQLVLPDEIIIVDNNCTDRTVEIVKKFSQGKNALPIRVVKETKQGITPARNKGFNSAKYELIARCDADTVPRKDWIKKIKEHFENEDIDALGGPGVYREVPFNHEAIWKFYMSLIKVVLRHYPLTGFNTIITKDMWNRIKDELCVDDITMHEDIDLAIHIFRAEGVVKYDKSLIVYTSGRRIMNRPRSFFMEYPIRLVNTIAKHSSISQSLSND
jgi:glycosyltransferase involved in cell wall biosynthesis